MDSRTKASGQAHGKIVLLGEHAVVHGTDAVALALNRGALVEAEYASDPTSLSIDGVERRFTVSDGSKEGDALLQIVQTLEMDSRGISLKARIDIPQGAGLGSSAALAAATVRAIVGLKKVELDKQALFEAVQASEKVFHGNPSGLDASMALEGGAAIFSRSKGVRAIEVPQLGILVFHSDEYGDTGEMVAKFNRKLIDDGDEGELRLQEISEVVAQGIRALCSGDLDALGHAMTENHKLLRESGVSTESLDNMVDLANKLGALGAKMTGGGGGGCAIVLVKPGDIRVKSGLLRAGFEQVNIG